MLRLEGIKKIFFTDEVETHALAGIHLEVRGGDYVDGRQLLDDLRKH